MTRSPVQPISLHCGSTTERGSSAGPMRQVPLACCVITSYSIHYTKLYDGVDIKLAHLSIKGKRVSVHELRSGTLASKLEERKAFEMAGAGFGDATDAFNLPAGQEMSTPEGEDNDAVLLRNNFV